MKIRWKLRMAAAQREVWTGAQLRRLLAERAGLDLSSASVSALLTKEPNQIKLSTLIALCTALECTPERPVRGRHHTRRAAGRSRPGRRGARRKLLAGAPIDAADVRPGAAADGEEATGLRSVRRAGGLPRPGVLLSVHAPDPAGRSEGALPGLRQGPGPGHRHRAVPCCVPGAAPQCGGPVRARDAISAGNADAGPTAEAAKQPLPAVRQARVLAL